MTEKSEEQAKLEVRVGNAIAWLAEHDPGSRFHCWWQAGFTPATPLPAHESTPEVAEAWKAYYKARTLYERLDRTLAAMEDRGRTVLPQAVRWQPAGGTR